MLQSSRNIVTRHAFVVGREAESSLGKTSRAESKLCPHSFGRETVDGIPTNRFENANPNVLSRYENT